MTKEMLFSSMKEEEKEIMQVMLDALKGKKISRAVWLLQTCEKLISIVSVVGN